MEALRRLSQTDDGFQRLLAYLDGEREQLVQTLGVHLDERIVRQAQGGFQVIDDLKRFVEVSKR